jgi:hypothetical protein
MDMKLEMLMVPVSDIDRAKRFYQNLGFCLDIDYVANENYRLIQFTIPGSEASIIIGKGITSALAIAKAHLGSLQKIARVVRLGVYIATAGGPTDLVKVADGASELIRDALGAETLSTRLAFGVQSLPLGTPVELEAILEVSE